MSSDTIYQVLIDYLEQRKNGGVDSKSIKIRLERIGKNEDEIQQLLIEFDNEWDREVLHLRETNNAKILFLGGLITAICIGVTGLLSVMNVGPFIRLPGIWTAGVAGGLMLAIKGWNGIRKKQLREKRLKIKFLKS